MTVSPQSSQQLVTTTPARYDRVELLGKLWDAKIENRRLRRRIRELEAGRAKWRDEARAWKWGALACRPRKSA